MARPIKEGLDYFPLDVDIDQDDKIALIEASHGLEGFGVVIKLLMKIYDNSYFYKWEEKEQLLFSRKVNVDMNKVNVIINDCLKWGLFSEFIYKKDQILTSKGIQKRYLEASTRRKEVKIESNYLLLSENEVNSYKNLVVVDSNSIDYNISTQSKAEESKGKESKAVKEQKQNTASAVIEKYLSLRGQMHPSAKDYQAAEQIEKEGVSAAEAVDYLVRCFEDYESNQKRHPKDKINSLNYCVGYILDRYYEEKEGGNNSTHRNGNGRGNGAGKSYADAIREAEQAERVLGRV